MSLLLIAVEVPPSTTGLDPHDIAQEMLDTYGIEAEHADTIVVGCSLKGAEWMPEGNTAGTPERIAKALDGKDAWGELVHSVDYLTALGLLRKVLGS